MKKIINQPENFVDEVIDALLLAHPGWIKAATADRRALVRADAPKQGRVGIVTGGGSGHMPGFLGYVGEGLCGGVAVGNVFSSPSSEQIFEATKAVNGGAGVLYVYGNYGGDVFNFDLASDMAELEGIDIKTVVLTDDVASAPAERSADRRGVAGMVFAFKCAGAAAERGDTLDEVARIAGKANSRSRTMGVGLSPTILPAAGKPTFTLPDGDTLAYETYGDGEPLLLVTGTCLAMQHWPQPVVDALAADRRSTARAGRGGGPAGRARRAPLPRSRARGGARER